MTAPVTVVPIATAHSCESHQFHRSLQISPWFWLCMCS